MKKRIAFDLDETLAVALVDTRSLRGFAIRPGCVNLLKQLSPDNELVLWSSSLRTYVNGALDADLKGFFKESYSWDEMPTRWKDIRKIKADYLIDDSDFHLLEAEKRGIEEHYILVPAYGSPADVDDPYKWTEIVRQRLRKDGVPFPQKRRKMTYKQLRQVLERLGYTAESIKLDAISATRGNRTIFRHPDSDPYIILPHMRANKIVELNHLMEVQNVLNQAGFWDSLVRQTGTENPAEAVHVLQTLAGIETD